EANRVLQHKNEEIQNTLTELKTTQSQLIHSEKMASLGELTAGIAHEIQNPLNFVNNFSEVSVELLDELKNDSLVRLPDDEKIKVEEIIEDLVQNLEKISYHGKRADAIVKGMLQHSRTSTGKKEPTDINALADEYLRLSYHGLRAKDKLFNAIMETKFDENLPKINVIPQDLGRVILNLYTNAFYSVNEKKKQNIAGYQPTVSVSTCYITLPIGEMGVEIRVKDNGLGIPQKVMDKIYQPFFSTKPTGQGTGLGLSISYEIITNAHGGEMTVETKEGEFAEFIIQIPQ
ncbi:MAG: histidine kinase, partial [Segetibacter sp.]|nr:histidine kinase [Segetibacter sp.]